MDIGLQTLQRREDIVTLKFSDIKDDHLYVIQKKTQKHGEAAYIRIKILNPLQEVLDRCRDSMLSPFLIHRKPDLMNAQNCKAKTKKHYTQITPEYLSKAFAKVRDQIDLFQKMSDEEKPTFHEIRSPGIKLYEDFGIDSQSLAGHTTRAMTESYIKGHEINWTQASAGLNVSFSNDKVN